jgi:broad specificity phosphatase PhoE
VAILLIRHGESEANVDHTIMKTTPDCTIPLTKKGEKQAKATALFIQKYCSENSIKNVYIFGSSFKRAKQTKLFILEELVNSNLNIKNKYSERLVEIDFGLYNGLNKSEIKTNFPIEHNHWIVQNSKNNGYFYAPKPLGESYWQVCNRIIHDVVYARSILDDNPENLVIVVAHGGVNRCFAKEALEQDVEWFTTLENPNNAEVWSLNFKDNNIESLFTPKI